jgi:UDP-N-acetylmuramoylalanine--D-glutamate ligase
MKFLNHKTVLILGLGESGLACVQFSERFGAYVIAADSRSSPPNLAQIQQLKNVRVILGDFSDTLLNDVPNNILNTVNTIVISPGISPSSIKALLVSAQLKKIPVISELDWFNSALLELNQQYNYHPIVLGVTGTNGKTTVTELTAHICKEAGLIAVACGNISPAALTALMCALDNYTDHKIPLPMVWVLELSSFQLHYTQFLGLNAAALLNISQDHLDWHTDINDYIHDKMNIFKHCALKILNRDDSVCMTLINTADTRTNIKTFGLDSPSYEGDVGRYLDGLTWLVQAQVVSEAINHITSRGKKMVEKMPTLTVQQPLMPVDALLLRGTHNHSNALAALLLAQAAGVDLAKILYGLRSYKGASNRCELVRIMNDVEYINDSKGTNVGATIAALTGLSKHNRSLILIAGGVGKGQDFSSLAINITQHCKAVILIGEAAVELEQALKLIVSNDFNDFNDLPLTELLELPLMILHANSLDNAVKQASELAKAGDTVLLSPACASFDMFDNYLHRAQIFVQAVNDL